MATTADATIKFCVFKQPLTAAQTFQRTARYAEDPSGYLQRTLGVAAFQSKSALMLVPQQLDLDMDMYGLGIHKGEFESHIARLLGKTEGLFFLTGTQAQLAMLKVHCQQRKRNRVGWHITSHLETGEELAYKHLYGLDRILLGGDAHALPTVAQLGAVLNLPEHERPAAILLEIPNRVLGCLTYSFEELQAISALCKAAKVALHCDGARLWEIEPYYITTSGKGLADLGLLFDSIYVSFYKGMQGITGAMIVHNERRVINGLRLWQQRAGGRAFTLAYEIADCSRAFNEMIDTFSRKRDKMVRVVRRITVATAAYTNAVNECVVSFVPRIPTCLQVLTYFRGFDESSLMAARDRVEATMNVRVFERLRSSQVLGREPLTKHVDTGAAEKPSSFEAIGSGSLHYIEWRMGPITEKIEDDIFVNAYVALCDELVSLAQVQQ